MMMLSPFLPPFFSLRPRRFLLLLPLPLFVAGAAVGVAAGAVAAGAAAPAEPRSEPARSAPHQPGAGSAPNSCWGNSAPAEPLRPLTCPARCATCCHESAVSRSAKRPSPHALACLCVSCLTAGEQPTELGPAHPSPPGDERGQLGHGRSFRGRLTATGLHCAGTLCAHQRQPLLSPRDLLYFMCMVDPRERTGGGVRECGVGGRRWLRESDAVVRESDAVVVLLWRYHGGRCGGGTVLL